VSIILHKVQNVLPEPPNEIAAPCDSNNKAENIFAPPSWQVKPAGETLTSPAEPDIVDFPAQPQGTEGAAAQGMIMQNNSSKDRLYQIASALAVVTVLYNLLEGAVSAWFGFADETLALFGFGIDSLVEVVSGAGVWHMVRRQRESAEGGHDLFERTALRITGWGFYILAAGLIVTAAYDGYSRHAPKTTFWGIVVSSVSICSMWLLIHYKLKVGRALNSPALLADAACTKVCLYLSVILLVSSAGYRLTGIGWLDAAGAFGISWFCLKEGGEALGKARGISCGCSCNCG
jgi:divalent metal cation (Fe/Co/Zn/Cd) transporter